eukprot:scaffold14476_cov120-Isochrysis_galbana.AAC.9
MPWAVSGSNRASAIAVGLNLGSSSTSGMGSATATMVPTVGMKFSQKPSTANTSQRSTPSAAREMPVARPTSSEMPTLPLM